MKLVINTSYGGITDESAKLRKDPQFIEDVECGRFVGREQDAWGKHIETLRVVEIPDEATDALIVNYDGIETVLYTIDGKIYMTPADIALPDVFKEI